MVGLGQRALLPFVSLCHVREAGDNSFKSVGMEVDEEISQIKDEMKKELLAKGKNIINQAKGGSAAAEEKTSGTLTRRRRLSGRRKRR